jgi:hypothetical protein
MTINKLKIHGFVHPIGNGPAFLIPLFENEDGFWVQEIDADGIITGFSRCSFPDSVTIVPSESNEPYRVGNQALYAFYLEDGAVIADTAEQLQLALGDRIAELSEYPFLRLEVLKFLGRDSELLDAIDVAAEKLRALNPRIAEKWKKRTEQRLLDKQKETLWNELKDGLWKEEERWETEENPDPAEFERIASAMLETMQLDAVSELKYHLTDGMADELKVIAGKKIRECYERFGKPDYEMQMMPIFLAALKQEKSPEVRRSLVKLTMLAAS